MLFSQFPPFSLNSQWNKLQGYALDIAVGPNNEVYKINKDDERLYKLSGSSWVMESPLRAQSIAVGPSKVLRVDYVTGSLYLKESSWARIGQDNASDVGIGDEGSIFIVSKADDGWKGKTVQKYVSAQWEQQRIQCLTSSSRITVDKAGSPWVVSLNGFIA